MTLRYLIPVILLVAGMATTISAQEKQIRVRIPVSQKKSLSALPVKFYRENLKNDSLDLVLTEAEYQLISQQYPGLKLLPAAPQLDMSDMAGNLAEALTFTKYPTYAQYDSMMHYFAETYPAICRIDTFGTSVNGKLLLAVKISDNVGEEEDEPAFLYTSTMHGDELVGYVLCLRLIDFILSNYGSNVEIDRIVDDVEIWINPLSNPDYTYYSSDNSVAGSIRPPYPNDYYDLNRGFPDPEAGDLNDTAGIYLENQYMMLFMMEKMFNMSANMHSGAEVVNYPWDHKYERHPDDDWFILISREYADEAHAVNPSYMDLFTDGITNGADWYVIKGGRQDYVNYYLHGREVTLELSNLKKVESENLEAFWNYNQWSLINMISQARYGIHGKVTNNFNGNPVAAKIWVLDHDNDSSWVESDSIHGSFYRYLKEGVYDLAVSANEFIHDTIRGVEVFDYQKTSLEVRLDSLGTNIRSNKPVPTLHVYPNPADGLLRIKTSAPFSNGNVLILMDLSGRTVNRAMPPAGTFNFVMDVSALHSGVYLLQRLGESNGGSKVIIR